MLIITEPSNFKSSCMNFSPIIKQVNPLATDELDEVKHRLLQNGVEVTDLSMINPDIPPPRFLIDKLLEAAVRPVNHRYSVSRGIRRLRQAFAQRYCSAFGVEISVEDQFCVVMGTKDGMLNALYVLCEAGDAVLVPQPTYPGTKLAVEFLGLRAFGFRQDANEVELIEEVRVLLEREKPRVVILNSPQNPTGVALSADCLKTICTEAQRQGAWVINDFVYGLMTFNGRPAPSLLAVDLPNAIEVLSLSKALSIPGWRIGVVAGPSSVISTLAKVKAHIDYGIFLPNQIAAAAALTADVDLIAPIVRQYQARAKRAMESLVASGFSGDMPAAGCSLWMRLPEAWRAGGSLNFAKASLMRAQVALTPGVAFGEQFREWIRIALVRPEGELFEAVTRLRSLL